MKTLKKLTILSLSVFAFACKKDDNELVITKPENKINFQTVYSNTDYSVQINPNASNLYDVGDANKLVLTNSVLSLDHGNFIWVLKPLANNHWSFKPTSTVMLNFESFADAGRLYKLDQILLPSDSQGATSIQPTESLPTAVSNPLKISVEFWKSELVLPMVQASEIDKGVDYKKQLKKGELLETKQITLNAENFKLVLPNSVSKGQVLDLKTLLDASVKTTGENLPIFVINDVTHNGFSYTVPTNINALSIRVQKKYANGVYGVTGNVAVN